MKLKVLIHRAEEGGFWAEVPSLPGCFSQGDTLEQTRERIQESIEAYLGLEENVEAPDDGEIWEIAV